MLNPLNYTSQGNFLKNYQTVLQSGTICITTNSERKFQVIGILSNSWYGHSLILVILIIL